MIKSYIESILKPYVDAINADIQRYQTAWNAHDREWRKSFSDRQNESVNAIVEQLGAQVRSAAEKSHLNCADQPSEVSRALNRIADLIEKQQKQEREEKK